MFRFWRKGRISLLCLLAGCLLAACSGRTAENGTEEASDRLVIVATLFPQYDFTRAIAGEYADVTLLLPPGVESHSYDLRPSDMITIRESDLFIYTGPYMETWAETLIEDLDASVRVVNCSERIALEQEDHYDPAGFEEEEGATGHTHELDPHVWTSPVYAITMCETIRDALIEADPVHAEVYTANAAAYIAELESLDAAFRQVVSEASTTTIYFGGRFAMTYFAREYGLTCVAAYDDCSAESEPSIKRVMAMIDAMKEAGTPVLYYEELVDPKVARTIAEETGAELVLLHSAHNVSKDDLEAGVTYLSLMWNNVEALRQGVN